MIYIKTYKNAHYTLTISYTFAIIHVWRQASLPDRVVMLVLPAERAHSVDVLETSLHGVRTDELRERRVRSVRQLLVEYH